MFVFEFYFKSKKFIRRLQYRTSKKEMFTISFGLPKVKTVFDYKFMLRTLK